MPPEVTEPITFGKYRLLDRISHGGMAEVFRAKTFGAAGFERTVAIKLLLPNVAMDSEFVTMLIDEAKIAGQLSHANIAQIFDLGQAENRYYIVQEYVHGRDLRAILKVLSKSGRRLSVGQAVHIILKVCEGLEYAHNKRDPMGQPLNLVHRDISPQNVVVSLEGEVKLIDFGIAKAEGRATRTLAGLVKGKFAYMSPEQIRGLPVDRRSDVFATGIVLHELLTGKPLFRRKSEFETLKRARSGVIDPPSLLNPEVPRELDSIVLGALARHVEDRYQSAVELRDALWHFSRTSGHFYSRNELSAWMLSEFGADGDEAEEEQAQAQAPRLEDYPSIEIEPSDRRTIVDLDDEERDSAERSGELQSPRSEMSDVGLAPQLSLDRPSVEISSDAMPDPLEELPTIALPDLEETLPERDRSRMSQRMTAQLTAAEMESIPKAKNARRTIMAASAPAPVAGPRPVGAPVSHNAIPMQSAGITTPLPQQFGGSGRPESAPPLSHTPASSSPKMQPLMTPPQSAPMLTPPQSAPMLTPPQSMPPQQRQTPSHGSLAPPAPMPSGTPNMTFKPMPEEKRKQRTIWPLIVAIIVLAGAGTATILLALNS